ncbi:DUF2971 domain-containing protein [Methyloglobulus sp.]|uniref:DUF2971 domain-containing protein n=1 Tax=Methyloglobulus sp. TaxID=2518622 RepID=UPI003988C57D
MKDSEKIWRYMDLAKLVSLLSKKALYFPCPQKFGDPFEGYFSRGYFKERASEMMKKIKDTKLMRDGALADSQKLTPYHQDYHKFVLKRDHAIKVCDEAIDGIDKGLITAIEENKIKNGVNCWHKSEYESAAMWNLYTNDGQGIAVESTIKQLKDSIICERPLIFESVIYRAEDEPKNDQHPKHDILIFKRKAFEHEKEFRAIIDLCDKEMGVGTFVRCDLHKLINRIHISPYLEPYFVEIVKEICVGKMQNVDELVTRSKLLDKPDYSISELANEL